MKSEAQKRVWLITKRGERTQESVANAAGIARTFYCQIENGERDPSVLTAKKIAAELKFEWPIFF